MKSFIYALIYGEWSCGWEWYDGKPKLLIGWMYYDGYHYVIHIGKLWINLYY